MCISELKVIEPFSTSDHDSIAFVVQLGSSRSDNCNTSAASSPYKIWTMANWEAFYSYCEDLNWPALICDCRSANELWDCFMSILHDGMAKVVPQRIGKSVNMRKIRHPKVIHRLVNKKKKLWKGNKFSELKVIVLNIIIGQGI